MPPPNQNATLSASILRAFGIPPDQLKTATKHLSKIILANFLDLVKKEASPKEKQVLKQALSQSKEDPDLFSTTVSEVMANNQTLQERTAQMLNDLYQDLIQTFTEHATPEEQKRFKEHLDNEPGSPLI